MRCNTRTNWEFYVVTEGRCGLRFSDHGRPSLHEYTLFVFAPECSHAWADDGGRKYQRISLHFGSVPYPLDEIVRRRGGWLTRRLSPHDIEQLRAAAAELEPHFCHPTLTSPVVFQKHLMELSLLALDGIADASLPPALTDLVNFKVEHALSWYAEHLAAAPTAKEVADAIHVSPSHLRRLFRQGRQSSPKAQFRRVRLEKARELMSRTALTIEEIARQCGYAHASHLCREHQRVHHFSPTTWRKRLVARFKNPYPPGVVHTREYSARPEERTMPA